ncbi:MAG: tyrosine--tRNA ligase, partial [Planctomycetaceae bacterium]|nr:tyrosine--tRNA ligase [Planctomycetaceae bacterium]
VPLRKMRQFQELGHQAVIIIGNYTAMVGDPSGRDEARTKKLSEAEVEANAQFYLSQVGKVIDIDKAEVHRNGNWFGGMSFADILGLCGKVTVAQLLTRDDFAKRMKAETPIYLHECLYPLMQAWDSVEIKADIELGGTEQLYSFMLARDLQKDAGLSQQLGVMSPILVGTDGKKRMGKSLGNYIGISEEPYEMMKKFMQLSDDCMRMYYELLTDLPMQEVDAILAGHPKEAKVTLAKSIITEYHDSGSAEESAARWQREIGDRSALPEEIPVAMVSRSELSGDGTIPAAVLLKLTDLCPSTSDARRAIQQGGAKMGEDKIKIESHDQPIEVVDGLLLWVGKKRFCQLQVVD